MQRAPIYDDHVERCSGPVVPKFMVCRIGSSYPYAKKYDTYEEAESAAKREASVMHGDLFEIRKVYTSK